MSYQIFSVGILFLQICELPEASLVPALVAARPVQVQPIIVSLHHVTLPVQDSEGVDEVSTEGGVDIIRHKVSQS